MQTVPENEIRTAESLVGGVQLGGEGVSSYRRPSMADGATRDMASISVIIAQQHVADDLPKMEVDAKTWIGSVLGESLPDGPLQPLLKDGVRLCNLVNVLQPGICPKPAVTTMPFKQMDNISAYLKAAASYGVPAPDSFQTITLYENRAHESPAHTKPRT